MLHALNHLDLMAFAPTFQSRLQPTDATTNDDHAQS